MRIYGLDFTSRPSKRKPITCAVCRLDGDLLHFEHLDEFTSFRPFEAFLEAGGPWVAGLDFPFGQAQRFIDTIGWPTDWSSYVRLTAGLSRAEFRATLDAYRLSRAQGDKEHRRRVDVATRAVSPQKLYGVPVGLMYHAGAPRLLQSGVNVPGLADGDSRRTVVEAYPGVFARRVTASGYKSDTRSKQSEAHRQARQEIQAYLTGPALSRDYGITLTLEEAIADDPSGDTLDALICAVQAAWAWKNLAAIRDLLTQQHRLEGWIADPAAFDLSR